MFRLTIQETKLSHIDGYKLADGTILIVEDGQVKDNVSPDRSLNLSSFYSKFEIDELEWDERNNRTVSFKYSEGKETCYNRNWSDMARPVPKFLNI